MTRPRAQWLRKPAVLAAALLFSGLAAEVVLRLAAPIRTFGNPLRAFHQSDPELGWIGKPDVRARFHQPDFDVLARSDADGFRARQSTNAPAPDSPVVAVLGDSFAWGWGVEHGELFTDVLQNELGRRADVRNLGVNAYGTLQELLLLERCLTNGLRPRCVVVLFCFNDFYDNIDPAATRPYLSVTGTNVLLRNSPVAERIEGRFGDWLARSHLLSALSYRLDLLRQKQRVTQLQQMTFSSRTVADAPRTAMAWVLARLKRSCAQASARLWLVRAPGFVDLQPGTAADGGNDLRRLCDQAGIPLIDLTPDFRDTTEGHPTNLFFAHDRHWNTRGHQLAGRVVAARLRQELEAGSPTGAR